MACKSLFPTPLPYTHTPHTPGCSLAPSQQSLLPAHLHCHAHHCCLPHALLPALPTHTCLYTTRTTLPLYDCDSKTPAPGKLLSHSPTLPFLPPTSLPTILTLLLHVMWSCVRMHVYSAAPYHSFCTPLWLAYASYPPIWTTIFGRHFAWQLVCFVVEHVHLCVTLFIVKQHAFLFCVCAKHLTPLALCLLCWYITLPLPFI